MDKYYGLNVGTVLQRKPWAGSWPRQFAEVISAERSLDGNWQVKILTGPAAGESKEWHPEYFDVIQPPEPTWEV